MISGVMAGQMRKAGGGAGNTVSYIGVSATRWTTAISIAEVVPAAAAVGDLLLAYFMSRSAPTPPSGWTLVRTQTITGGGVTQILSVYSKAAISGDAGASIAFTQASSQRTSLTILVLRGSSASPTVVASNAATVVGVAVVPIAGVTGIGAGSLAVTGATTIFSVAESIESSLRVSSPWIQITPLSIVDSANPVRTSVAYKALAGGEVASGTFTINVDASNHALCSISILVG